MKSANDKKLLMLVDIQACFINEQSSWLPVKLAEYIKTAEYDTVVATRFVNHSDTPCYKLLNWTDCCTESEFKICPELDGLYSRVFDKGTYTSVTPEVLKFLEDENFSEIHVCGISEACCVVATAYDLFDRGFNVKAIPALSAVTGDLAGYKEAADFMLFSNIPCVSGNQEEPIDKQEEPIDKQEEPIDLFGAETDEPRVLLTDHLASTCAVCPSIQAVKAGTKTPSEHCKTCQSCRKNLKGYATLLAYGGESLLSDEIIPTELLDPENTAPEQGTTATGKDHLVRGRGKGAVIGKRYGQTIEYLYKDGKTPCEIAEIIGISHTTVYTYLKQVGLYKKPVTYKKKR